MDEQTAAILVSFLMGAGASLFVTCYFWARSHDKQYEKHRAEIESWQKSYNVESDRYLSKCCQSREDQNKYLAEKKQVKEFLQQLINSLNDLPEDMRPSFDHIIKFK